MRRALLFAVLVPFPLALAIGPLVSCSGDTPIVREAGPDTKPCYTCTDVTQPDVAKCPMGQDLCNGMCVDTITGNDPMNCGACGKVCAMSTQCVMGRCQDEPAVIAAGGKMSVAALLDGTLVAFGADDLGQIGDDPTNFNSQCQDTICRYQPVAVQGVTNVTRVAAGENHACAVQKDGKLFCWGSNSEGQLGHDPSTDKNCGAVDGGPTTKCEWTPKEVTLPGKATDVAAAKNVTCAILETKDVYCWGSNASSLTGRAPNGFDHTPNKLAGFSADAVEISLATQANPTHGCGRKMDGTVMCWGKNDFGQLGQGSPAISATPITVGGNLSQVVKIVTAENVSCAWRMNGDTLCWGSHARGGLGNATPIDTNPHPTPGKPNMRWGLTINLFAGGATLFAKDTAEKFYVWGVNNLGQFGDGTKTAAMCGNDVCDPNTKEDPALFKYRALSIGTHVLGISAGGKLFAWGKNDVGQLGKAPGGSDEMCPGNVYCNPNPQIVQGL